MRRFLLIAFVSVGLSFLAILRTDGFSPSLIQGPLQAGSEDIPLSVDAILLQPFHYLSKGRQCFVFESQDGQYVLKFFNQNYINSPWYAFLMGEKEGRKRALRAFFYEHSYAIAYQELDHQILHLHLKPSRVLPQATLIDRAHRIFTLDLTKIPFVLQRKGIPIFSKLEEVYQKEGEAGLCREIDVYLTLLSKRMEKHIADGDNDIEHNWGYLGEKLFQLDPGRLYYEPDLENLKRKREEWERATRKLYHWLLKKNSNAAAYLLSKKP